jgi:hypothetical protein
VEIEKRSPFSAVGDRGDVGDLGDLGVSWRVISKNVLGVSRRAIRPRR